MRYLLLFLISLSSYANVTVQFKDKLGIVFHSHSVATKELAEAYVPTYEEQISWRLKERTIPRDGASQQELDEALEHKQDDTVRVGKEYVVSFIDSDELAMNAVKKLEECGQNAKRFLKSRVILRNLSAQQVGEALTLHANAMKMLEEGALDPAITLVQATISDGVILTDEDKTETIAFINKCKSN